jgi:hypothetical protein
MWLVFFKISTSVDLQYPKPVTYNQNFNASDMSVPFNICKWMLCEKFVNYIYNPLSHQILHAELQYFIIYEKKKKKQMYVCFQPCVVFICGENDLKKV